MKLILTLICCCMVRLTFAQYVIKGSIHDQSNGDALPDVSVSAKVSGTQSRTDKDGNFSIILNYPKDTLQFSSFAYQTQLKPLALPYPNSLAVLLQASTNALQEVVVSTGYYQIPKESATGSFTQINQALLNRSVSTDIISRLEGVASGLQFDRTGTIGENQPAPNLRVRGSSTLYSDNQPLIVLNNFPYEGDINAINPNDVESVTLLKDAAAASIWGARAGNGVIVITTKSGRYNQQAKVNFSSNVNIAAKPDLEASRSYIPSADWLGVEQYLFEKGYYEEDTSSPLPPYVELLIKQRDGSVSPADFSAQQSAFAQQDIRKEASKYLYQQGIAQQYAFNISGGSAKNSYYLATGLDRNQNNLVGDGFQRISFNSLQKLQLAKQLELSAGIYYSQTNTQQNGLSLSDIKPSTYAIMPYTRLADDGGNALAILRDYRASYVNNAEAGGLLNWQYRPLDELKLNDNTRKNNQVRLDAGLSYRFFKGFNAALKYQYQQATQKRHQLYAKESYFVRDLVNRYTQMDGSQIIPDGAILEEGEGIQANHYGRLQLNYQGEIKAGQDLTVLAGAEIRQDHQYNGPGYRAYNYNDEVLTNTTLFDYSRYYPTRPQGSARIPYNPYAFADVTDRNLSYFANAAYSWQQKYVLSASSRWDGSNLFGVKTNQKGVPLWSVGGAWTSSKETWWKLAALPYLKIRATYGINGNVNRRVSAYPTFQSQTNNLTGLPFGIIVNPGNPSLRWEKVKVFNLGADFSTQNERLSGSLDYYIKKATDLIGELPNDPTIGLSNITNLVNYAGMRTKGVDLVLNSRNLTGAFVWESNWLSSWVKNKVTQYAANTSQVINTSYLSAFAPPTVGNSIDAIYALPWQGLSAINGEPQVFINGNLSQDYTTYLNALQASDLLVMGSSVPQWHGAFRNTFTYHSFSLSANITWKAAYVFRRSSVNYNLLYNNGVPHIDYLYRWKKPGDELTTTIPAQATSINNNRELVYTYADILVNQGDHIRLQDVQMSYSFNQQDFKKLPFKSLRFSIYANNLGILWRANKYGVDPDYAYAAYPASKSIAFGLNVGF